MTDATRVVFDCNVLLQALASPAGPAGRCVQCTLDGRVLLFISPAVIAELRDVASRPKVVAKLRLIPARMEEFIVAIGAAATVLADVPDVFRYARDPDDAHYVNLAVAADARCIVSRDSDLLELLTASDPDAVSFRARFPQLQIIDPVTFLRDLNEGPVTSSDA